MLLSFPFSIALTLRPRLAEGSCRHSSLKAKLVPICGSSKRSVVVAVQLFACGKREMGTTPRCRGPDKGDENSVGQRGARRRDSSWPKHRLEPAFVIARSTWRRAHQPITQVSQRKRRVQLT
ncbi:MAG: hypothetical protein EOS37_02720 [Mesorhizobium sp.]|nr:MAG: hypothetical protein EOS37_02720 [Mesorhizobium sp.]RWN28908.1 MAG: hypothetical protein EOR96_32150 [Mesorhizobium sp.]